MRINISNHSKFTTVKRKLNLLPLTIDYDTPQAVWPFQIEHYEDDGITLMDSDLPTVQGQFTINNNRNVNPTTGIKIGANATEAAIANSVPEFTFLVTMLRMVNIEPLVLGTARVAISDSRGAFDNYSKLMKL